MLESGDAGRSKLEDIFLTMSYNDGETEKFSSVLNWLSNRGNVLTSTLGGNWLESTTPQDEFLVGHKPVSISYLDAKRLKALLKADSEAKLSAESLVEEPEAKGRIQRFQKLVEDQSMELAIVESVATLTPLWQIREYELPTWSHRINDSNKIISQANLNCGTRIGWIPLDREDYSIKNILILLSALIQYDTKFSLLATCERKEVAACFLPVVYIIDALNQSKIRKAPIDLLLLDRSSHENIQLLDQEAKVSQVFLWGSLKAHSVGIFSGVLRPSCPAQAAHFILDSSADVETAVDSIATEVWISGSNVNRRGRSLLFVHQAVYNCVRQLLEKRMEVLRTATDCRLKGSDFIRRIQLSIDSLKSKTQTEEFKSFPSPTDFSLPSLIWDVGTSCDFITCRKNGLGHLLFVIPYRSPAECLALANNYGDENLVFIHSADISFVKQLATNIKGTTVRVNAISQRDCLSSHDMDLNMFCYLQSSPPPILENIDSLNEEIGKAVGVGEKSFKSWSWTSVETRHALGTRAFLLATQGEENGGEKAKLSCLTDFMKVAGRGFQEEDVKNTDSLKMYRYKPYGVAGLILLNPEKMTKTGSIVPILLLILKGNVSIVLCVSEVESPLLSALVSACNSVLPPGVVQFISSSSLRQAVQGLAKQGNVPLLWILHSGFPLPTVDDIPKDAFSKVVIDNVNCLQKSIVSRSQELEVSKIIYL